MPNRYLGLTAALIVVIALGALLVGGLGGQLIQGSPLSIAAQPASPTPSSASPTAGATPMTPFGEMGQCMMGGGMGTMMGGPFAANARPIALNDAVNIANRQLQTLANSDLTFDEVEAYAYNFYVPVREKSTGNYAFAWIIDRYTGAVMPEMGPNTMWNTRYGMMAGGMMGPQGTMTPGGMMGPQGTMTPGGMMGPQGTMTPGGMMGQPGAQGTPTVNTPVSQVQAVTAAQQFLDGFLPGTKTGDVDSFYGFRTIDVTRDGQKVGMISVNGYDGTVWYHTWHGEYAETWTRGAS